LCYGGDQIFSHFSLSKSPMLLKWQVAARPSTHDIANSEAIAAVCK
jgi:hypothetical protein